MFVAGEAPIPSGGIEALLPPWAQGLSLVSLLIIIVVAFLRGWIITPSQNQRDIEAERRISDIWESNAKRATETIEHFTQAFSPILEQNQTILKIVQGIQDEQGRMRERGPRR